jgi:hypothetical protein
MLLNNMVRDFSLSAYWIIIEEIKFLLEMNRLLIQHFIRRGVAYENTVISVIIQIKVLNYIV